MADPNHSHLWPDVNSGFVLVILVKSHDIVYILRYLLHFSTFETPPHAERRRMQLRKCSVN